ncbi:MAG: hemerythrin domain-containing protein [Bryobacteraceae bacterium]|nr:hemerythrin domain-containing protein [Bryobacteraceae bacterium]
MDRSFITALIEEHRAIEAGLDLLSEAIRSGEMEADAIRELAESIARHYVTEESFLAALKARDPKLAAKLTAQHEEALEIGERLLESLENTPDAVYLARRFIAIAQHNMIEEERDAFPFAEWILGSEQARG